MRKFLIEGSCDGSLFSETVEAQSVEDAEAFAIERLCEAWGETYGPDTTLDDLGDAASVREYDAEDYARDAAPDLLAALIAVMEGVDGARSDDDLDCSTEAGGYLLGDVMNDAVEAARAALAKARWEV